MNANVSTFVGIRALCVYKIHDQQGGEPITVQVYPFQGDFRMVRVIMSVNCDEYFLTSRDIVITSKNVEVLVEQLHGLWGKEGRNIIREDDVVVDD